MTVKQMVTWIYVCSWDMCEWEEYSFDLLSKYVHENKHILYNNEHLW